MVALSSCEVEYIVGRVATYQTIWLSSFMKDVKVDIKKPMKLLTNNKSAISLAKNLIAYGRSKHIETKFHFLKDKVQLCMECGKCVIAQLRFK